MPNVTREFKPGSPLYKKVLTRLRSRIDTGERAQQKMHDRWRRNEEAVMAYLPASEEDRLRNRKRDNGTPQYTTIVVPYTYGMVMTAHTYLTSVFLNRSPVHQYAGRHGESEQATQATEALIAYNVEQGGILGAYYIWLYDVVKYGQGIVQEYWDVETIDYGTVDEVEDPLRPGKIIKSQSTQRVKGYEGNRVCNVSPFDFIKDSRVTMGEFQRGEYCITKKAMMWHEVVARMKQGYYSEDVLDKLKRPGVWSSDKQLNTGSALERPEDNTFEDEDRNGHKERHPAFIRVYEMYIRLVPADWDLGKSDMSQVWVFTISADKETILGAQPHGAMHGQFPFMVAEAEIEAYGEYNRGQPEILEGIQSTMDWLINSHFWNVRQTMNNQFIIDPSRVTMKDVERGGAGWVWRLRPEAYGTNPKDAIFQVETHDVTAAHIADLQNMFGLGERTIGINEQMMGAGPPGGRVTATSTRTSAGFGISRLKAVAEYISAVAFSKHSVRLLQNAQQYYDQQMKFRLVGDLMLDAGNAFIDVSPETIAGAYNFVAVDGTLPVDRFAQATLWKDMLGQVSRIPQVATMFDLGKIFAWVMQISGIKNINQMKVQMMQPGQIAQQVQAGNLIPQPGGMPGGGASSLMAGGPTALPAPGSPQAV